MQGNIIRLFLLTSLKNDIPYLICIYVVNNISGAHLVFNFRNCHHAELCREARALDAPPPLPTLILDYVHKSLGIKIILPYIYYIIVGCVKDSININVLKEKVKCLG